MFHLLQRLFLAITLSIYAFAGAFGQLVLEEFPIDNRLYGRVGDERTVELPMAGTVTSSTGITSLSAKLLVGTQTIDTDIEQLTFNAGVATFALKLDLPVTRTNHRVELRNESTNELLAAANFVVAGDVYLVNGQSNALAGYSIETVDRDPFLRGYNPLTGPGAPGWTAIENVPCGKWMGRTANAISNDNDLPIAVFNFAEGGQNLAYFEPGAPSQNFETVFERLREAGVKNNVKGFLWSQGEADGFNTTVKDYRGRLTSFFEKYIDSLPLINEVYLWQVRPFSCSGTSPNIMEAQRRMNEHLPYVHMLSTVNVEGALDSCHFPYTNGREVLGNWMADVLRVEKYGEFKTGYYSPTIDSARITGTQEISLFFDLKGAEELSTTGTPWSDFMAEGLNVKAISGSVSGNVVKLLFDTTINDAIGVSYYAHLGPAMDYLHSNRGLGVITFYNESITPGDRALGSLPDADLGMKSTVNNFIAGEEIEVEIELANRGDRSLRETEVNIPLPAALEYGPGQFNQFGSPLVFDDEAHVWLVPIVRPGESVKLTITYTILDASQPIMVWAQVVSSELAEIDSTPLNGIAGSIQEDDEARVILGDSSQNCSFSVRLTSSECTSDSLTYWRIGFASEGLQSGATVTFDVMPSEAVNWQSSLDETLSLSFDTLTARNSLPLQIRVEQNSDSTCARSFLLGAPDSCRVTISPPDTMVISNGVTPLFSELGFSPNPVKSGGVLTLSQNSSVSSEHFILMDVTGREVYAARLAQQQTEIQLPVLPAGIYFLRLGQMVGKISIY